MDERIRIFFLLCLWSCCDAGLYSSGRVIEVTSGRDVWKKSCILLLRTGKFFLGMFYTVKIVVDY